MYFSKYYIEEIDAKNFDDIYQFFKNIDIFDHWNPKDIKKFIMFLEKKVIHRNHFLFQEGDEADYLYFIKSGEFEVFILKT